MRRTLLNPYRRRPLVIHSECSKHIQAIEARLQLAEAISLPFDESWVSLMQAAGARPVEYPGVDTEVVTEVRP